MPESVYHLVKSCGSELVLEKPEKRQVLLENIWKQLKKKGEPLSVTLALGHVSDTHTPTMHISPPHTLPGLTSEVGLYNTLLQVYMQNDHKFPPSEFMEKMREDGIMPNQVTGSNATVRSVLELIFFFLPHPHSTASFTPFLPPSPLFLLPFSLSPFLLSPLFFLLLSPLLPLWQGTLVLFLQAYCNQGNMQGAMQILEHMKSLDLAINENVYASLITGHARADDIVGAEKLLHEMGDQITPGLLSFTALLCAYAERGDMASINRVGPWE